MRYRRDYQETHDIDWFFRYKGKVYHAASNGGLLPDVVDSGKNRELQVKLEDEIKIYESNFTNDAMNRANMGEDLSSFAEYAAKGFISLDREDTEEVNDKLQYRIVAYPRNGEVYSNEALVNLMPELNDGDIDIK